MSSQGKIDFSKLEGFEWDRGNLEHIKKHNVTYIECEEIFSNIPLLINHDKPHSEIEIRFQALGKTNNQRMLFIIFMTRNNKVRIISARDQNKKERAKL